MRGVSLIGVNFICEVGIKANLQGLGPKFWIYFLWIFLQVGKHVETEFTF